MKKTRAISPEQLFRGSISVMDAIVDAKRDDFWHIFIELAGLEPGRDFRYADLRNVDFGGVDLSGFDFTGADLRGANLRYVSGLSSVRLNEANTEGIQWPSKPRVFIYTNELQYVAATVSQYSFKRNSRMSADFEAEVVHTKDHQFLRAKEGQRYLRAGRTRVWRMDDPQSFTPLRFIAPELVRYEGQAVVVDPDVFAVGDVWDLLSRNMAGKAIMCRTRNGSQGASGGLATSVMLLDCAKLTHWRCEKQFNELFEGTRDYMDWIRLRHEPKDSIGIFEDEWNDFDRLTDKTMLLHTTKRQTQPWRSGLPIDFARGDNSSNQERFFFGLLRECLENGVLNEGLLREEIRRNHIRHDAFEVLEQTPRLTAA